MNTKPNIHTWAQHLHGIYGAPSMVAIPFALASPFAPFIRKRRGGFPLLYLYGPGASGKTSLVNAMRAPFTEARKSIFWVTGNTTRRELMQANGISGGGLVHVDEYHNRFQELNELLKAAWGGFGYRRGSLDGKVATRDVAWNPSVVLSGNEYPMDVTLLSRMVVLGMEKSEYSPEERAAYSAFQVLLNGGLTHLREKIEGWRPAFERDFALLYVKASHAVHAVMDDMEPLPRMRENVTTLFAVHLFLVDRVALPYTTDALLNYLRDVTERQLHHMRKPA